MLPILIAMLFGGVSMKAIDSQTLYCDCFRSDFSGKVCQEIKGSGEQGSCRK